MSWLELDDRILEHPKFIRAVKLGGSEAIHLWLGLRAYCGQQLSDGFVPSDMLDEARGPTDPKRRARALDALRTVGLVDDDPAGIRLHDFLDWSSSRAEVEARRAGSRERQRRSRVRHAVTDGVTNAELPRESQTPARAPAGVEGRGSGSLPEGDARGSDQTDGETTCPPGLASELEALGVVKELAKAYRVPERAVSAALDEFVSYWVLGAGAGERRKHWPKRARERVRDMHREGKLASMGKDSDAERAAKAAANDAAFAALVARERAERGLTEPRPVEESKNAVAAVLAAARAQSSRGDQA